MDDSDDWGLMAIFGYTPGPLAQISSFTCADTPEPVDHHEPFVWSAEQSAENVIAIGASLTPVSPEESRDQSTTRPKRKRKLQTCKPLKPPKVVMLTVSHYRATAGRLFTSLTVRKLSKNKLCAW